MITNIADLMLNSNGGFLLSVDKKGELFSSEDVPDLYKVRGLAPTYTNGLIGGVFENLTMNWWVFRRMMLKVNYRAILDKEPVKDDLLAVSQLFLLREAEIFKEWIDKVFPEENTEIIKVEYPIQNIEPYPNYYDIKQKRGSFWSNHDDWLYDLAVCYYIDTNNVKVRAT